MLIRQDTGCSIAKQLWKKDTMTILPFFLFFEVDFSGLNAYMAKEGDYVANEEIGMKRKAEE